MRTYAGKEAIRTQYLDTIKSVRASLGEMKSENKRSACKFFCCKGKQYKFKERKRNRLVKKVPNLPYSPLAPAMFQNFTFELENIPNHQIETPTHHPKTLLNRFPPSFKGRAESLHFQVFGAFFPVSSWKIDKKAGVGGYGRGEALHFFGPKWTFLVFWHCKNEEREFEGCQCKVAHVSFLQHGGGGPKSMQVWVAKFAPTCPCADETPNCPKPSQSQIFWEKQRGSGTQGH